MSPEEKKDLQRMKTLKVREDLPEDLKLAIETFIEQEYMENLLKTMAKYPEHNLMLLSLIEILKREDLLE